MKILIDLWETIKPTDATTKVADVVFLSIGLGIYFLLKLLF